LGLQHESGLRWHAWFHRRRSIGTIEIANINDALSMLSAAESIAVNPNEDILETCFRQRLNPYPNCQRCLDCTRPPLPQGLTPPISLSDPPNLATPAPRKLRPSFEAASDPSIRSLGARGRRQPRPRCRPEGGGGVASSSLQKPGSSGIESHQLPSSAAVVRKLVHVLMTFLMRRRTTLLMTLRTTFLMTSGRLRR